MNPEGPLVVLSVVRTTPAEYDGTLSDGRRIYARCRDGAWCVRVAETTVEDAIAGREIVSGTVDGPFGYHVLRRVTHGIVRWPRQIAKAPELSPRALVVEPGVVQAELEQTVAYEELKERLGL